MIAVAEVWAYVRCPFRHFWRYQARIAPPPTARGLAEEHVRRALSKYYAHAGGGAAREPESPSLMACVGAVWRRTVEEWGCGLSAWDLLVEFAAARARVVEPFLAGRITKPDGSPYKVPEMSAEYRRRASSAGLPALKRRLEGVLSQAPVLVDEAYGVTDAFADSVEIVERNAWPVRHEVLGVAHPYEVDLIGEHTLKGTADLVIDAGDGAVRLEVHDYDRSVCLPVRFLRRDLRVVAAHHASCQSWNRVEEVVYRHMQSGTTVRIPQAADAGRLLTAALTAVEGIRHEVYVPRLAVQSRDCLSCSYYQLCIDERDVLDTLAPTLLAAARRRVKRAG